MPKAGRTFQIFAKPNGSHCNLSCAYCYYLGKNEVVSPNSSGRMDDALLESYIKQHIQTSIDPVITFSWHGGEPSLLGVAYFRKIRELQKKYQPAGQTIANGIQTNGTLIDKAWAEFLAKEGFVIGLSLDGPQEMHDRHRLDPGGKPTFAKTLQAYHLLKDHGVYVDILCVVNHHNGTHPLALYDFYRELGAPYITLLPLVMPRDDSPTRVSPLSVSALAWGDFLCTLFDRWKRDGVDKIKFNIFEETARLAFGNEQALCIFRKICGDIPVVEHNGDFFSCDHFVNAQWRIGNIQETPLVDLLESRRQKAFGRRKQDALPKYCRICEVKEMCNGGCPKDRIIQTPDGDPGLNYLCAGYRRFFNHFKPFLGELTRVWCMQMHRQTMQPSRRTSIRSTQKVGRNHPCPCGSGKKFKHCCLS